MPFPASCCCPRHDEWKHGDVDSDNLRQCSRKEAEMLDFASNDPKNKKRKRKICIYCRSRLEVERALSQNEQLPFIKTFVQEFVQCRTFLRVLY